MCTATVHESFASTHHEYERQNVRFELDVKAVHDARIVGARLLEDSEVNDPSLEGQGDERAQTYKGRPTGRAGNAWLSLQVRYDSEEVCRMYDRVSGKMVQEVTDTRGHQFSFARRIPSELPVEGELDSPWVVYDIT